MGSVLTAGVRLLLDKIICGGEEVASFACASVHILYCSLIVCLIKLECCVASIRNKTQHRSCFPLAHCAQYGPTQEKKDREVQRRLLL